MTPSIARTQLTADYSIPKIINGGWQLATGHALAHALDMKDAHNAFAELLDRGFDTFDCADIYTGLKRSTAKSLPNGAAPACRCRRFTPNLSPILRISLMSTAPTLSA